MKVRGTTNLYGYTIGILVIEGHFPRLPGALGNATTFAFPVLHHVVAGATGDRVVRQAPDDLVTPWIEGARALETAGVRAITTSCGFTAMFQRELTEAVDVPVFASSLLLVPLVARMLKPGHRVGILTADARHLTRRHFEGVGIDPASVVVAGLEGRPEFDEVVFHDRADLDVGRMEAEVVDAATSLVTRSPDVRALLLECSLLPPFAHAIQAATRLPVFDFTTLVEMVHASLVRKPFTGLV
ncbi:MAG TPA: aspartate/glutamate racemase family protein [Candidatus Methylomirabilis sp.]|nr:aspartate/glutamate racemase family protein [Candidatus Methylomirabilis sp.]